MRDRLPIGGSPATEGAPESVAQAAAAAGVAAAAGAASSGQGGGSPGGGVHNSNNSPQPVAANRTAATTQHPPATTGIPASNDDTVGGAERGAQPGGGPVNTSATAPAADTPQTRGGSVATVKVSVQRAGGGATTSPPYRAPSAEAGVAGALATTSPRGETIPLVPASMVSPTLTELPSYRDRMTLTVPSCDVTPLLLTTERQEGAYANIRCGEDAISNRTVCSFEAHWPSRPVPGLHQQTAMQIAVSWVCLMACWQPDVFLPGPRQVAVLRGVMEAAGVEDTEEMQREVLRGAMEVQCP